MASVLSDFFTPLPQEILIHIYSNLSLEELLRAWRTGSKIHQRAIEFVVFTKNNVEFYSSQLSLLRLLSNLPSIFNNNNDYLNDLKKNFIAE